MQFISNLNISKLIPKNRYLNPVLKVMVFVVLAYHIGVVVQAKDLFSDDYVKMYIKLGKEASIAFVFVVLLFPVNWAFEALKWRFLIRSTEKVSFFKAWKGILTGVAFGFATPHGIGDYAGRILQLDSSRRSSLIGAVFVSRIAQFYITFLFGSISLVYFFTFRYSDWILVDVLGVIFLFSNFLFFLIFLFHRNLMNALREVFWFRGIYKYFSIIRRYSLKDMLTVLSFSLGRYLIFTLQYIILLYIFDVNSNFLILIMGVGFIFFVKSVLPTLFDLGVRESAALFFFGFFHVGDEGILVASLLLWAINILIPAIMGMFMSLKIKIVNRE